MNTYIKKGVKYINQPPADATSQLMFDYQQLFNIQMKDFDVLNDMERRFKNAKNSSTKRAAWKLIIETGTMIDERKEKLRTLDQCIYECYKGQYEERDVA